MCADSIVDFLRGWCFILSGTWGFLLLPFAMALVYQKKARVIGIALLMAVILFFALLCHDIVVYRNNKRPFVPFYEWIFTLFIPHGGSSSMLLDTSLSNCTTNISHYWRGDYGVTVWIPDKMRDVSEKDYMCLDQDVYICGTFECRGYVVVSFNSVTNRLKTSMWSSKSGGSTIHYEYNVPKDLPLDETLTIDVHVEGNLQKFMARFPDARLRVEKLCVK